MTVIKKRGIMTTQTEEKVEEVMGNQDDVYDTYDEEEMSHHDDAYDEETINSFIKIMEMQTGITDEKELDEYEIETIKRLRKMEDERKIEMFHRQTEKDKIAAFAFGP